MKVNLLMCGLLAGLIAPATVFAWDGAVTSTVTLVEIYPDGSFTVALASGARICPINTWNVGSFNLKVFTADGLKSALSAILAAKLSGGSVTLYSSNNTSGPCIVGAFDLN